MVRRQFSVLVLMPIENPYAKRLPSDRIGRIRTGSAGGSSRTPHPAAGAALSLDSTATIAAASASAPAPAPAASAASAPSGRANSSTAALHHHQCQPNHNSHATAQPARSSAQAQPPAAPTAPQPQLPPKLQQAPQLPPKQRPQPQQSLPYHARLPSRRVSFSAAEIVSVSELAQCLPTLQLARADAGGDTSGNHNHHGANKAACKSQRSVRFTRVVLHVDLPGRFVLVGDGAAGARPSLAEASTANRGRGRGRGIGAGAGAVGMGAGLAGRGLGRGVGGIGRGIGGIGIGKGIGMGIPSAAQKTPLNRYARTSMGGSVGSMGSGRGIGSAAERTSLGGGNRSRKSSVGGGVGGIGSIGSNNNSGNGLLHTAKKRKLVYTGGKKSAAAAAAANASAGITSISATATGSGIGAGTGIAGGAAMATPRQGGLPSPSRRSFPGAARGTAIGRGILRTPRTTGIGSSMGGSSKRPIRPPSTLGPPPSRFCVSKRGGG